MRLSPDGLSFLEHEEGLRTSAYEDQAGKLTIGCGHLLTSQELESGVLMIRGFAVPWKPGLTMPQVTDLLGQDCEGREVALTNLLVFPPAQHQFDALFSLYFNIGDGAFARSTLAKILNGGDWTGLDEAWLAWKFAGGKPVLLGRRQRELAMFHGKQDA